MKTTNHLFVIILLLLFTACEYGENAGMDSPGYQSTNITLGGDSYSEVEENPFINTTENSISTFSVDADGASYANVRRFIQESGVLPPKGAIRTEEFINYFQLNYDLPKDGKTIAVNGEVSSCPWNKAHQLVRIGIKGKKLDETSLPASNFVFLIDVSGSMDESDRLGLLQDGFKELIDQLSDQDRIAIVSYADSARLVLSSTLGSNKRAIKSAIDGLIARGRTAGDRGIRMAYEVAEKHLIADGNNRVIVGTDGDFNVGLSSENELVDLIEEKRETGIFLSILGVGRGYFNDAALEQIADHGNGTYEYADKLDQMRKIFIYDKNKFYTIAKDVKVQVEFAPRYIKAYRLIGYENRLLSASEFNDDNADGGEIGSNQNITALYEIVPQENIPTIKSDPFFRIDFRYKEPSSASSQLIELEVFDKNKSFHEASDFMKFTASAASFSMLLGESAYMGNCHYDSVLHWLNSTQLKDDYQFKSELKQLVQSAKKL